MRRVKVVTCISWIALALLAWHLSPFRSLPTPLAVIRSTLMLWCDSGFLRDLITTLSLISQATVVTAIVSLPIAYCSVTRFLWPLSDAMSKLRYLGPIGFTLPMMLMFGGGWSLKVALLSLSMTPFLITAVAQIAADVNSESVDSLRALGASKARAILHAVVIGTAPLVIDAIRQVMAMGWCVIAFIEISDPTGGLGVRLFLENKAYHLDSVYAIMLTVLIIGTIMDAMMATFRDAAFPHIVIERSKC